MPILVSGGFKTMRGAKSPGSAVDPAEGGASIDNASGLYAPLSVASGLYGKIGKNTPARMSLDGVVQLTGEAQQWVPFVPLSGPKYTDLTVGGVLQRIGDNNEPFQPAYTRSVLASDPTDYWPLDDGPSATQGANLAGGAPMTVIAGSPKFGDLDGADVSAGLAALPTMTSATFRAVGRGTSSASSRLEFTVAYVKDSLVGYVGVDRTAVRWTTSGVYDTWNLVSGDGYTLLIATSIRTSSIPFSVTVVGLGEPRLDDGNTHHIVVDLTQTNSTTMAYNVTIDGSNVGSGSDVTALGAQQVGPMKEFFANPDADDKLLTVGAVSSWSPRPGTIDTDNPWYGWDAETADNRFARLCAEEGYAATVSGGGATSVIMGPQTTKSLLEQFDEIVRTDDALIFETRGSFGLTIVPGPARQNRTAALTISRKGQVRPPLAPVYGSAGIQNDVTVSNPDGTTGRYVQQAGPHNILEPTADPQGVGRYPARLDVNAWQTEALTAIAAQRVHIGTYAGVRYAEVTIDLDAAPGIRSAVDALDIGDLVLITGLPVEESPEDFPGEVIGVANDAPAKRRLVTLFLAPADPYRVGVLSATTGGSDAVVGRAAETSETSSTTSASVSAGAASFTVATSTGPLWTTVADDFPLDVVLNGQRVSVSAISGASSPQTFTVQSAASGGRQVRYAVASGKPVLVYQPLVPTL